MKESATYQAILEEGRVAGRTEGALAEARKLLYGLGADALGRPDARTRAIIDGINDVARLEELCNRTRVAKNWQQLLGQPPVGSRGKRRESR